jgi:Holliday junction resolvase RusA-like endonuclease
MHLLIKGQCPSGKNAVIITRKGRRFPSERFEAWRELALWELKPQLRGLTLPITEPVSVRIFYWASSHQRRDVPGILDALWHLLEKAGVVDDDRRLGGEGKTTTFTFVCIDKENPRVSIEIFEEKHI